MSLEKKKKKKKLPISIKILIRKLLAMKMGY